MAGNVDNKKTKFFDISLAYRGYLDEPVPSELFDAVVSGKAKRALTIVQPVMILLAGVVLTIIVLPYIGSEDNATFTKSAQARALTSHSTYADDQVYPVRVSADDIDHLNSWLSYRLGKHLFAPSLDNLGYTLLGANILPDDNQISATLVYQNKDKVRVSVFIRKINGAQSPELLDSGQSDKFNWINWDKNWMRYVVVSELDRLALEKIRDQIN